MVKRGGHTRTPVRKLPLTVSSLLVTVLSVALLTIGNIWMSLRSSLPWHNIISTCDPIYDLVEGTASDKRRRSTLLPPPSYSQATDHLLTIAVDSYGSCPEKCQFVHTLLPPWVRFRYIGFKDQTDLAGLDDPSTHLLIVGRTNTIQLGIYAHDRKLQHPDRSVGFFHMADERIFAGEIGPAYFQFDYVLRHYWSPQQPFHNMTLRALGNHTCGTSPPLPILEAQANKEPPWGVHWLHLDSHALSIDLQRSAASSWPISKRPVHCSFGGRRDVKRSVGERAEMAAAVDAIPELGCKVEFTQGFAKGNDPFWYFNRDLGTTKIGLCPRGSAIETHRLTEVLRMGAVPAVKEEPYLFATFQPLPGIIGRNWTDIANKMKWYLTKAPEELEQLGQASAKFAEDLQDCMTQDLDVILRGAFGMHTTREFLR